MYARARGRTGPSCSAVAVAVAAMGLAEARRTLEARREEPENALLAPAFESPARSSAIPAVIAIVRRSLFFPDGTRRSPAGSQADERTHQRVAPALGFGADLASVAEFRTAFGHCEPPFNPPCMPL